MVQKKGHDIQGVHTTSSTTSSLAPTLASGSSSTYTLDSLVETVVKEEETITVREPVLCSIHRRSDFDYL